MNTFTLELDYDTADKITLEVLMDAYKTNQEQVDKYFLDPAGYWLHPEDVTRSIILCKHLETVIEYFGGDVDGL